MSPQPDSPVRPWFGSRFWAILIAISIGFVAAWLNVWFCEKQQPFYDSLAYLEHLHDVMTITAAKGWWEGAKLATNRQTVWLPFALAIPLSYFFEPARWIGTAIQSIGVAALLLMLDRALRQSGIQRTGSRVFVLAGFSLLAVVWFGKGGLGDFRMDFSLMLGYGVTCLSLGSALRTGKYGDWALTGLAAAATCLVRATAPVYLLSAALPVCLVHAAFSFRSARATTSSAPAIRQIVSGMILAFTIAALGAGWFYWINFEYLKYYYLVWNTDANARLPLSSSAGHALFVFNQIGWPALYLCAISGCVAIVWRKQRHDRPPERCSSILVWQLELLWLAAVPLGLLIFGGAGPNQFVSMPTTVCLFCCSGLGLGKLHQRLGPGPGSLLQGAMAILVLMALAQGMLNHRSPKEQYMQAHQQAIDSILEDSRETGNTRARIAAVGIHRVFARSVWGVIIFDRRDTISVGKSARIGQVQFHTNGLFALPTWGEWNSIPGKGDEERCDSLVGQAEKEIDYLIVPDEATAALRNSISQSVVNRFLPELREKLLAGGFLRKIGELASPVNPERFELYRVEPRR